MASDSPQLRGVSHAESHIRKSVEVQECAAFSKISASMQVEKKRIVSGRVAGPRDTRLAWLSNDEHIKRSAIAKQEWTERQGTLADRYLRWTFSSPDVHLVTSRGVKEETVRVAHLKTAERCGVTYQAKGQLALKRSSDGKRLESGHRLQPRVEVKWNETRTV